jgi:very-short-patch-repair endonuclease
MTLPEVLLWNQLKGARLGASFRKQHPIGPYVADLYCAQIKLVIEVDGEAHNCGDRPARDAARDVYLIGAGFDILRIAAADILKDMDGVLQRILAEIESPLRPLRGHLPVNREDLQ